MTHVVVVIITLDATPQVLVCVRRYNKSPILHFCPLQSLRPAESVSTNLIADLFGLVPPLVNGKQRSLPLLAIEPIYILGIAFVRNSLSILSNFVAKLVAVGIMVAFLRPQLLVVPWLEAFRHTNFRLFFPFITPKRVCLPEAWIEVVETVPFKKFTAVARMFNSIPAFHVEIVVVEVVIEAKAFIIMWVRAVAACGIQEIFYWYSAVSVGPWVFVGFDQNKSGGEKEEAERQH